MTRRVLEVGSTQFGFVNVPDRLFKRFTERQHARDLVERGSVRIGTLYEFRATEGWDPLRADSVEGRLTTSLTSESPETLTEATPGFLGRLIERIGIPLLSHGGTLNINHEVPDAYIYCTLAEVATNIRDYGDFVVAIDDVEGFFATLTCHLVDALELVSPNPHGFIAPCIYRDRMVEVGSAEKLYGPLPPIAFLKPASKRSEGEVRSIWHPLIENPAPIVTDCPALAEHCRYTGRVS